MNLLGLVKDQLTAGVISQIGGFLGEKPEAVTSGFSAALPAVLGGFIEKSSTTKGAGDLLNLIKSDTVSEDFLGNIGNALIKDKAASVLLAGKGILDSIFGRNKLDLLTGLIGKSSGLNSKSSTSLLSLAAPLLLGTISKQINNQGLGVAGLTNMLMGQKDFVKAAAPAGLDSILSVSSFAEGVKSSTDNIEEEINQGFSNIWPWILFLLLLLGGMYFWKSCQNTTSSITDPVKEATSEMVDEAVLNPVKKTLSTGIDLIFGETSIENELISFIEDDNKEADKTTWFNFRNLTFEKGSAVINAASQKEVENIAEILKAYPTVHLKIGGYTDNTGPEDVNIRLSSERAANVLQALVDRGIDSSRLESEGYGPQHPIASNDTEEGKTQNRRIAVRVSAK